MKEQIVKFKRGPYPKKYTAIVKNKKTHKSVAEYIDLEKKNKLDRLETYLKFANNVKNNCKNPKRIRC